MADHHQAGNQTSPARPIATAPRDGTRINQMTNGEARMNAIEDAKNKIQRTRTPKQRQLRIMFVLFMIVFLGFLFTSPKHGTFGAYLFYFGATATIVLGSSTLLWALEVSRERRGE